MIHQIYSLYYRNTKLEESRLEKEHALQLEQMRLENERRREEREHELKIFQLLMGKQVPVAQPLGFPPVAYAQHYGTGTVQQQAFGSTSSCGNGSFCDESDDNEKTYFKL